MQKHICLLVEKAAKFKGKKKKWFRTQTLYWQAFDCLFENSGFRKTLEATNGCTLTHSIGKSKKSETVLTTSKFIGQLNRLRRKL